MKIGKKKIIIIISIILILGLGIGVFMLFSNNQFFINMPCSYICKQLEKQIPIGTSAEEVVEVLRSHKKWTNGQLYGNLCDYQIYNGGVSTHKNKFINDSHYSLMDISYQSEEPGKIGSFTVFCDLGSTPAFEPFWGKTVNVYFVFDEEQQLIDILVYKSTIGF